MNGMDGMDGGSSSGSSGGHDNPMPMLMSMVFQTNPSTPLYTSSWTPQSPGAYAGTCLFLIFLAITARLLLAARTLQEARWLDEALQRRYVVAQGQTSLSEMMAHEVPAGAMKMALSANGVEEAVVVVAGRGCEVRPWRVSVDPLRAVMDTVIVGVGYLLMLAVMTMNVGYFLSVLAGVFVGSLAVGRYSSVGEH
ncbi:hypothetical protein E4U56_001743 [Claviceps arundinis]|uniref:Copper transport protein n=1 Tax=Claviceps arundinis TaxID=1623583 RepID=A0A9P7SPA4_9HYPO|nr:hypothetical protein E4U56_001743 [Claviceps arundinis]